jgi:hypothetical protein
MECVERPGKIQRECPACGIIYQADPVRLRHGRQTTCSRVCSYRLRSQQKERQVGVLCATCKVEFTRSPAQVKAKHGASYCSRRCHYLGRTAGHTKRVVIKPYVRVAPVNRKAARRGAATRKRRGNHRHSDGTRRKLAEATTRNLAAGKLRRVSRLEDEVAQVLAALGIGFARQFGLRDDRGRFVAVLDFLLADGTALEVNGTYWHADPRTYPAGLNATQRRNAVAWRRKVAALAVAGVPLVVVWEADFRQHPRQAVLTALGRSE